MPQVHAKISQADKGASKYLLCPQVFIMKCLSERSQRSNNEAGAAKWDPHVPAAQCVDSRTNM